MKGIFIPEITTEMFRNGCLENIEALMTEGKIYDIDYELECKMGRWTNKNVVYGEGVDAWQECECSKCGRWDTRPYMYYFDEPKFCSFCGTKMQREKHDEMR